MLDFNEEEFLAKAESTVALRPQIEDLARRVAGKKAVSQHTWATGDAPIKNVYFIGAGGTYAAALPYELFMRKNSSLPTYAVIGKEFILAPDKDFGPGSLAVFASVSGTTPDILECIEFAKKRGAHTIGFTGIADSPFAEAVDEVFLSEPKAWPFDVQFLLLSAAIANERGEFGAYLQLADQIEAVPQAMVEISRQAEPFAERFAREHGKDTYHFLVGSGNLWGFTYLFSMCILEEMQWLHTTRVDAAEFFHGSLELLEKDTSLLLFMGEDESRPLAQRVADFSAKHAGKASIMDTRDYAMPGISEELRPLFSPLIADTVMDRVAKHLSRERNHSLDLRRYYRVVEY